MDTDKLTANERAVAWNVLDSAHNNLYSDADEKDGVYREDCGSWVFVLPCEDFPVLYEAVRKLHNDMGKHTLGLAKMEHYVAVSVLHKVFQNLYRDDDYLNEGTSVYREDAENFLLSLTKNEYRALGRAVKKIW